MKKLFLFILLGGTFFCNAQEVLPLTSMNNELPLNAYIKDIDNQLPAFEGKWEGISNNKTFTIVFKKVKYYDTLAQKNPYYKDMLWGKFQVKDLNGKTLFDNLSLEDNYSKIQGMRIHPSGKYELIYIDPDLCNKVGLIMIGFTDSSKKELKFKYKDYPQSLDSSCFYYGKPIDQQPDPLPKEIILTKQ
ncbi:hypothetical protein A0O34_15610 [Chryseobacterium glaciei]|uniref:DUF6705 domain-containing protein n=1 Tax=Chryseobacterium glaciei TaxID=1685010 RepID=A0A172XXV6_9FLAO|nr:DUF6705 family protein [Chryseobacterium glaciei]ANF51849.1 hypothetical protein A0O34_15610 [Chryseobacterium glaciei]